MANKQPFELTAQLALQETDVFVVQDAAGADDVKKVTVDNARKSIVGYKLWAIDLAQISSGTPTATAYLNQLSGTPAFARTGTGTFTITLAGAFPSGKVPSLEILLSNSTTTNIYNMTIDRISNDVLVMSSYNNGTLADGVIGNKQYIEVKVFY